MVLVGVGSEENGESTIGKDDKMCKIPPNAQDHGSPRSIHHR